MGVGVNGQGHARTVGGTGGGPSMGGRRLDGRNPCGSRRRDGIETPEGAMAGWEQTAKYYSPLLGWYLGRRRNYRVV